VVQIGQHEIMYFDERLSRTRALTAEGEDDAVPLVRGAATDEEAEDDVNGDDAGAFRAREH
jgi:hypothetical protein